MNFVYATYLFGASATGSDSRWIWLTAAIFVVAGVTFIASFVMLALREAIDKYIRRTFPLLLGLPTLGAIAVVALLVEVVNEGYLLVVPGLLLGVLCILVFTRKLGPATTVTELVESYGVINSARDVPDSMDVCAL